MTDNTDYGVASGVQGGAWVNEATGVPGRYTDNTQKSHYGVRCTDSNCPDASIENHSHIDPADQTRLVTEAVEWL
jgi:hypothetical protein